MFALHRLPLQAMIIAAGVSVLVGMVSSDAEADGYELLTAAEYALRKPKAPTRSITKMQNEGPEIVIHNPDGANDLRSPLDFDVEFRARSADPDMATLKLEYDLGLFWKDVTRRMADHAEITDNRIISRGAELPVGDHNLRLSISDKAGKITATEISFTIADG